MEEEGLHGGSCAVVSTSVNRHEAFGPMMSAVFMILQSSAPVWYRTQSLMWSEGCAMEDATVSCEERMIMT